MATYPEGITAALRRALTKRLTDLFAVSRAAARV